MPKIKIYSTPTCIWCAKTREFFRKHKVKFTDIDVSSNRKAAEEMVKKSGQMGVPIIDIDGKIIVGYNEGELKKALNLKD
ncbi:MAG TPA: glutaredoxin family protein [Candidatus Nanoarchaeia archaeon]|nr:glutaredoxin family protein [Candidatus Nanoarchaeia archaeon]